MRKKIILIGAVNNGNVATCGETMKNQILADCFRGYVDKICIVDTFHCEKRQWILFKMIIILTFCPSAKVVISSSTKSAYKLIKFLYFLRLKKKVYYWVVGGSFHEQVNKGNFNTKYFHYLNAIIVQGNKMKQVLEECGLQNIVFLPNSKPIIPIERKKKFVDDKKHFVFLSRIDISKGCEYIFESVNQLNSEGYINNFEVDFYGEVSENYTSTFRRQISTYLNTTYKGFLNLRDKSGYEQLAKYNIMLFPTFWEGEGFPGVVIDAYTAGLPIIASDWNLNRDVINDGNTGIIIPANDVVALTNAMRSVIEGTIQTESFVERCIEEAKKFDTKEILSQQTLTHIGLI